MKRASFIYFCSRSKVPTRLLPKYTRRLAGKCEKEMSERVSLALVKKCSFALGVCAAVCVDPSTFLIPNTSQGDQRHTQSHVAQSFVYPIIAAIRSSFCRAPIPIQKGEAHVHLLRPNYNAAHHQRSRWRANVNVDQLPAQTNREDHERLPHHGCTSCGSWG